MKFEYYSYLDGMLITLEYDSKTQRITTENDEKGRIYRYETTRNPLWTLRRISGAYPKLDDNELFENIAWIIKSAADGELEEDDELQLIALTLLYRRYGTAFMLQTK